MYSSCLQQWQIELSPKAPRATHAVCVFALVPLYHHASGSVVQLRKAAIKTCLKPGNERVSLQYNRPLLLHNNCTFPVHIIIIRNFRHTNYAQALTLLCHTLLRLLNGLCVIICSVTMVKVLLIKKEIMSLHFFGLWIIKKKTWNSEPFGGGVCAEKGGRLTQIKSQDVVCIFLNFFFYCVTH